MAKATPVSEAPAAPEAPAAGIEIKTTPVGAPAPKVNKAELEALAAAAVADGKVAYVTGNAVRIDN